MLAAFVVHTASYASLHFQARELRRTNDPGPRLVGMVGIVGLFLAQYLLFDSLFLTRRVRTTPTIPTIPTNYVGVATTRQRTVPEYMLARSMR